MPSFPRSLIVIPTYNEKDNIQALLKALFAELPEANVVIVDDRSPDGTGEIVRAMAEQDARVHLLSRAGKDGLGAAYRSGFEWSRSYDAEVIVQMDADLSHRPQDLARMLRVLINADSEAEVDAVIGSRYVAGGAIRHWSWFRRGLSFFGNAYARFFLGSEIRDWTSGFVAWRASAFFAMDLRQITSSGYAFQIELKQRARKSGLQIRECPIVFEDVGQGQSKMNAKIAWEALYQVPILGLKSWL
jgi:dolichol-phosphate mannosyltransferase